jgi:hypothetical protein
MNIYGKDMAGTSSTAYFWYAFGRILFVVYKVDTFKMLAFMIVLFEIARFTLWYDGVKQ